MNPCRSDCPQGDCANCVDFGARARCEPAARRCPQVGACARACEPTGARVIDASISLKRLRWCPLFVDRRGAALEAAPC
jgi:hypothetical protein